MGGWINTSLGLVSIVLFYVRGNWILFAIAIVATLVAFWSHGVMSNYAIDLARDRFGRLRENMILEGRGRDEIEAFDRVQIQPSSREIASVPNWITAINLLATAAIVCLLLVGGVSLLFFG